MTTNIKPGDKITVLGISSMASTFIKEVVIDSVVNGKLIYASGRKKYYVPCDSDTIVLMGHGLGIKQGGWKEGDRCVSMLMSSDCCISGLDRESMIALLNTNLNPAFNAWKKIKWYDGSCEGGDPLFEPRPISEHYLEHRKIAHSNRNKQASELVVGDFIYAFFKSSKYNDLADVLESHLTPDKEFNEYEHLGQIERIIEVTDDEFDSLSYMEHDQSFKQTGGNQSLDVAEGRDEYNLSKFEIDTFYALFTIVRTPTNRAIVVDSQGYDYMRYTGLLLHYRTSMKSDCEKAMVAITREKERQEKEDAERKAAEKFEYDNECARVKKDYPFLETATEKYDYVFAAKNLRKLLKHTFPTIKFSVSKYHYNHYTVSWTDGPTEDQVVEITRLFKNEGFDGMTDSSYSITSPFIERYGGVYASVSRTVSDNSKNTELELVNSELNENYQFGDYISQHGCHAHELVYRRLCKKDLTPIAPEKTTKLTKSANNPGIAGNIELVAYSDKSFAIIGDTKPIKDTLKELGGCFNGRLSCGAGWIFSNTKLDTVKQTLSI